jgi:hypothetical protein
MTLHRLSTLPITSPPAPHETPGSYLHRLENLNGLPRGRISEALATGRLFPRWSSIPAAEIDIQQLSRLRGHSPTTLRHAIPELREPPPDPGLYQWYPERSCCRCTWRDGG